VVFKKVVPLPSHDRHCGSAAMDISDINISYVTDEHQQKQLDKSDEGGETSSIIPFDI
jgi:hypothetical protein